MTNNKKMETKMTEEQLKIQSLEVEIAYLKNNSIKVEYFSNAFKEWCGVDVPAFYEDYYYRIAQPQRETITLAQFECWDNGDSTKQICVYKLKDGKALYLDREGEVSGFQHYELIPNTEYKAYKDTLKRVVE